MHLAIVQQAARPKLHITAFSGSTKGIATIQSAPYPAAPTAVQRLLLQHHHHILHATHLIPTMFEGQYRGK
jgi:hypothetical protein